MMGEKMMKERMTNKNRRETFNAQHPGQWEGNE